MARGKRGRPSARYSQAGRLLVLYDHLQRGDILRAEAFVDVLNVSKRTVLRDIAELREVVPGGLTPVPGPPPGWQRPASKRLWRASRPLVMGLVVGTKLMRFLSGRRLSTELRPLLSQLRAALPGLQGLELADFERCLHVVETGHKQYRSNSHALDVLGTLLDAALLRHPVRLQYLSGRQRQAHLPARMLEVQVLCVTVHRGAVYIVVDLRAGLSPHGATRILLALDRIQEARSLNTAQPLPYPRDFTPQAFFASAFGVWRGDVTHHITLHVDARYADAVRERAWHDSQQIEELPDGSLRLRLVLGTLTEVADWVLGMGEHVRVETPPDLVELVKSRLAGALARYA